MQHLLSVCLLLILFSPIRFSYAQEDSPSLRELQKEEFEESLKFHGLPSVNRFDFVRPQFDQLRMTQILGQFDHLDPNNIVPDLLLERALAYYVANGARIKNKNYLTIIDYTKHSGQRRFYVIDMKTGAVEALHTAHGSNSDPDNDGHATIFSNTVNSLMSSLGFALTAETYEGKNGNSLRLDGLEETNSNLRERAVVVHKSNYVSPEREKMGLSWGCPAITVPVTDRIISQIKNGSLLYKYGGQ